MASKASALPAVRAHFNTLRDDRTGAVRPLDIAVFVGLPAIAGLGIWFSGFRMRDIAAVLAGLAVFTALLFGLVIFVFQLRVQIKDDGRDLARPRISTLIDETFANVTYSVVVGLATTVVAVIAAAIAQGTDGTPSWISGILAAMGLHLVLTILMCLKRIYSAYEQLKI